ncbi:MAG: hypothetical protein Fur0018_26140 [Anaerolineales bacterium]
MRILELLQLIRPIWLKRAVQRLAHVPVVQERFADELGRFFSALEGAVSSGEDDTLKQFADQWVSSLPQSDVLDEESQVEDIITRLFDLMYELGRELLAAQDVILLYEYIVPLHAGVIAYVQRQEMERRVQALREQAELARQQLEHLDESKSRFISVAAHELKTPLTLIDGYAAMMRDMLPPSARDDHIMQLLDGISGGTRRLQQIIDDMLDVSLIDNHLLQLSFQQIWIDQVFSILQREMEPVVKERRQHLKIGDRITMHRTTYGDPERLYQAFLHLMNNAIKFTPDGGSITVGARLLPGFIEITIADTGIGINPADQDTIFQKFGRLGDVLRHHSSGKTKFKGGGPGLGLPIVKGIIEAHGGTVWVESEGYDEEKCPGSTFHVLLPLRDVPPKRNTGRLFPVEEEKSQT